MKIHLLTGYVSVSGAQKSFCGKSGWEDSPDYSEAAVIELIDARNCRYEATTKKQKATCKNCLRAAER